jgi:uncharacterized coiled-coil DUF342 family protein
MIPRTRFVVLAVAGLALVFSGSTGQDQRQATRASKLDPAAVKAINEMGPDLEKLAESHRSLMKAVGELEGLYAKLSRKAEEVSRLAEDSPKAKGDAAGRLAKAAREMREMQQSFNLQFLQLQNKISHENRQFTMVSNIMKTKHDTAKNAINNVR